MDGIYRFQPILKSIVWGGENIASFKGLDYCGDCIGESWEISAVDGNESVVAEGADKGRTITDLCREYGADLLGTAVADRYGCTFPLLIKLIDARSNLSVQVHPDDCLARSRHNSKGKTEMWYVIDCDADAKIYAGLAMAIDADRYAAMVADNTIMDAVKCHTSAPGQLYFIPAGTVHAIGAGNLIAEIQQSSDITYRIYDYNRRDINGNPRQLHTELAKDAIDYTFPSVAKPCGDVVEYTTLDAVKCRYFSTDYIRISKGDAPLRLRHDAESFTVLMVVGGELTLTVDGEPFSLRRGDTVLLPAKVASASVEGDAELLCVRAC